VTGSRSIPSGLKASENRFNQFVPAVVDTGTAAMCPSCNGSSDFERSIECGKSQLTNQTSSYSCGGTESNALVDTTSSTKAFRGVAENGVQCLINYHSQDTIAQANFPSGPMEITPQSGPFSGPVVSTSQSIANFPSGGASAQPHSR